MEAVIAAAPPSPPSPPSPPPEGDPAAGPFECFRWRRRREQVRPGPAIPGAGLPDLRLHSRAGLREQRRGFLAATLDLGDLGLGAGEVSPAPRMGGEGRLTWRVAGG